MLSSAAGRLRHGKPAAATAAAAAAAATPASDMPLLSWTAMAAASHTVADFLGAYCAFHGLQRDRTEVRRNECGERYECDECYKFGRGLVLERKDKRVVECCLCGINNEDDTRCMFSYVMLCCVSYIGRTWPLFTTS